MKNPWIIIGIITVVLFAGAIWLSGSSSETANEGVELKQHVKGNLESSIKLVEYSDFQCPACGAFQPVVTELMGQYGEEISFEYKHFPLSNIHNFAIQAAVAAEAAGQQDKFFEFHDMLFENQGTWSGAASPGSIFIGYAEELGLDIELFRNQMKSSILRDKVKSEFDEGRKLGISGTPTFFLNGQRMEFDSYASFVTQIAALVDPSSVSATGDGVAPATEPEVKFGI